MDPNNTYQKELERVYNFRVDELELNRFGQVSAAQRKRLDKHRKAQRWGQIIGPIVMALTISAMGAYLYWLLFIEKPAGIDEAIPYILTAFGLVTVLIVFSLLRGLAVRNHVVHGKISVMEGVGKTIVRRERGPNEFHHDVTYFKVGRKKHLPETQEKLSILIDGYQYRFFYVWNGSPMPIILSVEALGGQAKEMNNYKRVTRECTLDDIEDELSLAIRASLEAKGLEGVEHNSIICIETTSTRQQKKLLRLYTETILSGVLLTPEWLIYAVGKANEWPEVLSTRLTNLRVEAYEKSNMHAVIPDTGLNIYGIQSGSEIGTIFIGLGTEPAAQRFRNEIDKALKVT
ncbi:MAG: hypothetical protein AB8G95_04590 [Anaerolineae bacterium]